MHVIMIDKQQIFIDGMSYRLSSFIPEMTIHGVSNEDELWGSLACNGVSLVVLDGDMDKSACIGILDSLMMRYPNIPVAVIASKYNKALMDACLQRHVRALITRDATPEFMAQALKGATVGMMCLPVDISLSRDDSATAQLSARQKEILQLLADGESNKQISRQLNISAGTVKAHLESIFQKLNVHNRTQAAMKYSPEE